jgi:hypothetical protein
MTTRMSNRVTSDDLDAADEELEGDEDAMTSDRATLLESEAAELRARLDALLDAIGRQGGRRRADLATLRRYAPALIAVSVTGIGCLAFLSWRRRRRLAAWARLTSLL